ncbi:envelope stress response membrane protein PspC [Inquilinus limosus]|uniref:Transcriptional regulator n=1 Tax=Inquilinus limosus MP06 TaxID=1398085 RepID=A0A0A0CXP3_9PROT|nr:envelope stress response membrane protein PspC [Inquilinus limosus]KGM31231.1 transcriptional regulator [Inquilinus limosus MP06]
MSGRFTESPNPHRLYRDPDSGMVFGVCAGLAAYFGVSPGKVRFGTVVLAFFFFPHVLIAYLAAAMFLKRRPTLLYRSPDEEVFWRSVSVQPADTFSAIRHNFRELEQRLAGMERYVTSSEFKLNRDFRDLEGR